MTTVNALLPAISRSHWKPEEILQLRDNMRRRQALNGNGHTISTVMDALSNTAPDNTRLCIDAGAHMFSAINQWPAKAAYDVLKSNGLSTMGFALPAAIASALHDPNRAVIALTGDGGLLMCLAELTTALAHKCRLVIVVSNDSALSLIDVKQQHQQQPSNGVRYRAVDFAATARALGCAAWRVGREGDLSQALSAAFACDGPALVDILVDASGYADQLSALRG